MSSRRGRSAFALGSSILKAIGEQRQAGADVADEFGLRKVHFLDRRRQIADVQHRRPVCAHEEGRLLHRVVADGDNQIRTVDRAMDIVALRQRGGAHIEVRTAGDGALPHLRVEERNLHPPDELRQSVGKPRPARRGAQHDQRPLSLEDKLSRPIERGAGRDRQINRMGRDRRHVGRRRVGDVFRQFKMNRARPLKLCDAERLPHHGRDGRGAHDLIGHLGQRRHGRNDVDHLKARLFAAQDALLSGDHHHGHRAEQRVSRPGRQIERAGAKRRDANPRLAGEPPVRRRHESRRLLVAGQNQLDLRAA